MSTPSRHSAVDDSTAEGGGVASAARPSATAPSTPSVAVPAIGLGGAVLALLIGGWLMLAPFALGYQPPRADWTDATTIDFFNGLGVAVLAVATGALLARQIAVRLRVLGLAGQGREPAEPAEPDEPASEPDRADAPVVYEAPAAPPVPGDGTNTAVDETVNETAELLAPLIEALRQDIADSRRPGYHAANGDPSLSPYEQTYREDRRP